MITRVEIEKWMRRLQDNTCEKLESADGRATFSEDLWDRPGGGGGRTRVLAEGNLLEKAGVNFSAVYGNTDERMAQALDLPMQDFYATGVSSVLHPQNPHVPIIHMNVRYFEMGPDIWWFGGGIDLTPHFIDTNQAVRFHTRLKKICDKYSDDFYPKYSDWADRYFYIKHRKETRGVGGIFFDRLDDSVNGKDQLFEFIKDVGDSYADIWTELAAEKRDLPFNEKEKRWQLLRRGRYVEFNLVYDKGTKFGLETEGRIESILMSLPKHAMWEYDYQPEEGSREAITLNILTSKQKWVND